MRVATYVLEFRAPELDSKVGDELIVSGRATIKSISAGLVDITSLGADSQFTLGEVTIDLVANRVSAAKP